MILETSQLERTQDIQQLVLMKKNAKAKIRVRKKIRGNPRKMKRVLRNEKEEGVKKV